ncbi:low specificity L-threonine aldolase [Turicibacter sanguinis]|uniref:threonine aldolase family protein n=1 Tax=Turicibacter sanguinis TaxID=154288 RepID=UPI00232E3C38|nr:low specificity L-threonine aldolase [Turicibacter sanguinis]MDB8543412.1 low specificity L-threonine aldolase [Turicibacter sanguinis]
MIRFESDYAEGVHPRILEKLILTNEEQTPGYGVDIYCDRARQLIKNLCQKDDCDVHFLVGGTQTNLIVISSILRPYQGVISAISGHINTHETGAIEATGHKVLAVESEDGKITAAQVKAVCDQHHQDAGRVHKVQPGMVYISQPTEYGTLYSLEELTNLSRVCKEYHLPLFVDGARLGYGMVSQINDVWMSDLANLCDVFYIGGTKIGALFGEAVVISNDAYKQGFRYNIKQRGGLLAKGRLLGLQFETLFEDNLYFEMSLHAVKLSIQLRQAFTEKGFELLYDSYTNQQFPILPNDVLEKLSKKYSFIYWKAIDELHSAVRLCTSWATKEEYVEQLVADIKAL